MEKYGFIYIWFDRKHKRYYLGRHWGYENDCYICSSTNMRNNYNNRPSDFKRRVIKRIYTNMDDLVIEEQRWLDMITPVECNSKYYNKSLSSSTPSTRGYKHSTETRQKIAAANKGKFVSEETKQKLRKANKKQFEDQQQINLRKKKSKDLWSDPEYIEKQNKARSKVGFYKGNTKPHSEKTKQHLRNIKLGVQVHNEESKKRISEFFSNLIWITNGKDNKRINRLESIPDGYRQGRTRKT